MCIVVINMLLLLIIMFINLINTTWSTKSSTYLRLLLCNLPVGEISNKNVGNSQGLKLRYITALETLKISEFISVLTHYQYTLYKFLSNFKEFYIIPKQLYWRVSLILKKKIIPFFGGFTFSTQFLKKKKGVAIYHKSQDT